MEVGGKGGGGEGVAENATLRCRMGQPLAVSSPQISGPGTSGSPPPDGNVVPGGRRGGVKARMGE